ncbi:protein SMG7, partial [Sesamum angolense]
DIELRGFLPILPAQLILDFSRKHSFGNDGGNKGKIARVQRIIAAGKALANVVRIGQEGVYFDTKLKKFVFGVEPRRSDDYLLTNQLEPILNGSSLDIPVGSQMALGVVSKIEVGIEAEDEDEVIVFKPSTTEKHMDELSSKLASEVVASVGGAGKIDFGNENGSLSTAHDSFLLQSALSSSMKPSATVANSASQYLQPIQPSMSKWPVEHAPIVDGLAHLNLTENGLLLQSELQDRFGVPQPAALPMPYPHFVNTGASNNYSVQIPQATVPSKFDSIISFGAYSDGLSVKPSSVMAPGLKKNPVSRPVRHFGPPPGFGSVPSKVVDDPLYSVALKNEIPIPQMDDYSWLDGYQLSLSNQSVGFSNSMNQVGPTFSSVSKSNGSMEIAAFPFPGKQVSTAQVQNENQKGWRDNHLSEHMKQYDEQQQQFQKGNQQPIAPRQQYQGQSLWEGRDRFTAANVHGWVLLFCPSLLKNGQMLLAPYHLLLLLHLNHTSSMFHISGSPEDVVYLNHAACAELTRLGYRIVVGVDETKRSACKSSTVAAGGSGQYVNEF